MSNCHSVKPFQKSHEAIYHTLFISAGIDTGLAIYNRYHGEGTHNVGYAAHFGGALVGM